MANEPLEGKVAVITGAGAGIGRGIAVALANDGARVAVLDVDLASAQATADSIGDGAWAFQCDVANRSQVRDTIADVRSRIGPTNILVNNAGLLYEGYTRPFGMVPEEDLRRLFDVNIHGVIACTLACAADMRTVGGGAIVNIASDAAFESRNPYGVSKLAVRGLTVAFAIELSDDGTRVNAIAPGAIGTEHLLGTTTEAVVQHRATEQQLVKRVGQVNDIVEAMRYLVSDTASFVTGQTIRVNGGFGVGIG